VGSSSGQALPKHPSPATGVGKWGALQCHPLRNSPRQLLIWAGGELLRASAPKTPLSSCWCGEMGSSSVPSIKKLASSAAYLGLWGAPHCKHSQNPPHLLLAWRNGALISASAPNTHQLVVWADGRYLVQAHPILIICWCGLMGSSSVTLTQ